MPRKYFFSSKKKFFRIPLKFGRVGSTFVIFRNFTVVPSLQVEVTPVVPPLQVQVTHVVPPLVLNENF